MFAGCAPAAVTTCAPQTTCLRMRGCFQCSDRRAWRNGMQLRCMTRLDSSRSEQPSAAKQMGAAQHSAMQVCIMTPCSAENLSFDVELGKPCSLPPCLLLHHPAWMSPACSTCCHVCCCAAACCATVVVLQCTQMCVANILSVAGTQVAVNLLLEITQQPSGTGADRTHMYTFTGTDTGCGPGSAAFGAALLPRGMVCPGRLAQVGGRAVLSVTATWKQLCEQLASDSPALAGPPHFAVLTFSRAGTLWHVASGDAPQAHCTLQPCG